MLKMAVHFIHEMDLESNKHAHCRNFLTEQKITTVDLLITLQIHRSDIFHGSLQSELANCYRLVDSSGQLVVTIYRLSMEFRQPET